MSPPTDKTSLETFANIAFQCLHISPEQRPKISLVVQKLEIALKFQKRYEMKMLKKYDEHIIKAMKTQPKYRYLEDLVSRGKRVLHNLGKTIKEGANQKDATTSRKGTTPPQAVEVGGARKLVHFEDTMNFTVNDLYGASAETIRKGTYGTVYKAVLENGDEFAVTRFKEMKTTGPRAFETNANLLGKIRHPNLLSVRAYCIGPKGDMLLVFYYITERRSIATFLKAWAPVCWETRMKIAIGIARGLFGLHTYHNIIHGNLTSNNVFLDKDNNPKIADFGYSRFLTDAANSSVIGTAKTLGYHSSFSWKSNTKTDVYSLGVIMLELLTGKQPKDVMNDLPQWVASRVNEKGINEVFDLVLSKDSSAINIRDELLYTLELALQCVDLSPSARPQVHQVLQLLENATSSNDDVGVGPSIIGE